MDCIYIPEPQPAPSLLSPRETVKEARVLMMTWTGGCAIENNLEVQCFSSICQ